MIEYIEGRIAEKNPAYIVIDCGGIAYFINISLNTFSQLKDAEKIKVFIHQVIREDMHLLYGFADNNERKVFRHLISVSGVGANTARMILSSLTYTDVQKAILSNNVSVLQSIKGIGAKTAQRIIVDLKDKIGKTDMAPIDGFTGIYDNTRDEAILALSMLGFNKNISEKVIDKILAGQTQKTSVEELIKLALKNL